MEKITLNDFERNHFKTKRSWRYCLALLFGMLFMGISSFAQTIQLGSGTTTNSYLPMYYLYDKNYTQTIYTAAELTNAGATATGGTITKIRFKPTASVTTLDWRTWTVYMDNTTKVGFTSTSDWVPSGDLTQVFTGDLPDNTVANTWIELTLDTPFVWDGSNIVVAITEFTPDYGGSPSWASYTLVPSSGSKAIYKYQDGADISMTSPPTGTLVNVVAQIQFDGSLQELCAGTPSGGTSSLTPNGGNSGSNFIASATGVTGASGLTFQWQKSINGTWQDIAGATSITSTITAETGAIGVATDYRLKVTCTASTEIGYSTISTFTIALTYCTPVGGGNSSDEMVNFTLNNLNNTSLPSAGVAGYKDYSGLVAPAQLEIGVPYIATVKGGTGSGNHGAAIWIDYNGNGTFEATEKVSWIGNTIQPNVVASFPEFVVPTGTPTGIYRLRVQHRYNMSGELLDPCIVNSTLAETEDYSVQVFPAPTCIQPATLNALNITSNSANLSWTSTGTSFDIEYGLQGFIKGSAAGTVITGVAAPYALNTGLLPNTSYSFYVRQNCGPVDGYSLWTGPFTFKTACAPVTSFTENFDSYTAVGATNPLPNCWTRFGNTGSSYITTGSGAPMSGANRLYLSGAATGSTNGVAVLPEVTNLSSGTHRLKFKAYASATLKALEVGYYDIATDASSFVVLEAFDMPSTALSSTAEFIYVPELNIIPAGIQSLAFRVNGGAFTGTTTIYIDDVIWEALPSCADVTQFELSNITSSSVEVFWNPIGTETAWKYVYGLSTVTDPNTLTPVNSVNNNPYIELTGLESNTSYKLWVRSDCGNGALGNWSAPQSFTTQCGTVTTFTENFDSSLTGSTNPLPSCWLRAGNGSTYVTSGAVAPTTPPNRLYMFANGTATTPTEAIAIMPPVSNLEAGTHRLKFRAYGSSADKTIEIGYFSDPTDLTSYVFLQTINLTTTTAATSASYTYIPTGVPAGVTRLAFKNAGLPTSYTVYIDDVVWETQPLCPDVNTVTFGGSTTNTATISWLPGGSETAWEYAYALTSANVTDPTTLTAYAVSLNPQTVIPDLLASSTYKVWIRSTCGVDKGVYSTPLTFVTSCEPVATFSENFDSYTATGSANPLPLCWERAGNGSTYITTGGAAPGTAPNRLYMFGSATTPSQAIAIMPPVSNLQANTHRLKFKAYTSSSATGRYIEVGYYTNSTDLSTFVLVQSVNIPGTLAATAQTFVVNPSNIPAGVFSLAFRNPGFPTTSTTVYIDDVVWEAKPTVVPVCATNVVATPNATCGNFATAITWTATPDADGYNLRVGTTAGGTDVLNNLNIGNVTSYNLLANANTTYFYSVIPYNSAGPATTCPELTYTTAANGCYCTSVPTSNDASGISNVLIGNQNFPTGDVMYFDHTATPIDLAQGLNTNLKVTLATGYSYHSNVWIDFNDNFTFEAGELVYNTLTEEVSPFPNPYVQDASFLMPANATLGQHRMRIVSTDSAQNPANPCYSGTYGVTLDFKVNITVIPTCLAPMGLNVTAGSITTEAATINWTASTTAAAEGYDYYYSTTTTAPLATTDPIGSVGAGVTTVSLSGLANSSTYYFYVRSKCSTTDSSAWSQAFMFTTLCGTTTLPYTIDFENATIPNLPSCTTTENVGTGNNWETVSNPGNGFTTKALRYAFNLTNAANTWFFTNKFNLVAGTEYSVTYKYGSSSTLYVEKLKVAYGIDANSTAMTTQLADHPNITTATLQNNTVTFTPTVSGLYVIGFNAYSIASQFNIYVDDIVIQENLGNTDFNNNKFTAYPNPVKNNLTIRYNENIKDVTVFNLLGQQLFVKNINATEGKVDMSNLSSGTYLVKVNSGDKVQTIKVIKE